jgi:hypothetical protein
MPGAIRSRHTLTAMHTPTWDHTLTPEQRTYGYHRQRRSLRDWHAGIIRTHVLPTASDDIVWRYCEAVRSHSKPEYRSHVPTKDTHSVEDARWWLDGYFA